MGTPYEFGASRNSTALLTVPALYARPSLMHWESSSQRIPQTGRLCKSKGTVQTNWKNLKRGDLMYFMSYKGTQASSYSGVNKSSATITHTGIYLGNGKVLHTYSNAGGGVTTSDISGKHWEYRFLFGGSAL